MIWTAIIASIAVYSWKILGYLVPERYITPALRAFADRVTVAVLAALVGIQGFTQGGAVVMDVRVVALGVGALMLWLRAPYVLVVLVGALVAAGLRLLGL
ncbi:MAG: AzlD domain-containing protein [Aquiluna sp.]